MDKIIYQGGQHDLMCDGRNHWVLVRRGHKRWWERKCNCKPAVQKTQDEIWAEVVAETEKAFGVKLETE